MNSSKKLRLAVIHQFLPEEIVVLIFKKLDYKSMLQAQGVCKKWNQIITGFGLLNVKNFREYISFIFLRMYTNIDSKLLLYTDLGSLIGNSQCGNFRIFLPLRFYVESILIFGYF